MANPFKTRRPILGGTLGSFVSLCVAALPKPLMAATRTPRATEGPFYPTPAMRREDVDNDLVKITGLVQEAGGEVITLKGRATRKPSH